MTENPALAMELGGIRALDASAGTGKTYSIALIYLRLVLKGIPVDRILVTTFTEAAASELRERLHLRLVEAREALSGTVTEDKPLLSLLATAGSLVTTAALKARLEDALSCFDLAPVCTIHGFCHRLIRDHVLELGARVECELMSEDPRLGQLVDDFFARRTLLTPAEGEALVEPSERDLRTIARKLREYDLGIPAIVSLAALRTQAESQWKVEAQAALQLAATTWAEHRVEIITALTQFVNEGKIQAGVFDNPDGKPDSRWTKLNKSISDTDDLLSGPVAPDLKFSAGVKRLLASSLLKSASAPFEKEIEALVSRIPFFLILEDLAGMSEEFSSRLDDAGTRTITQDFIQRVLALGPQEGMLFSDLINAVYKNLGNPHFAAAVRSGFDAVLVDECQDTDARQLEIFRSLFTDSAWIGTPPSRCLVWVGDPKQSIYRFRGADIETYVRAKADAMGGALTLDVNFRSDNPLVAAINALFTGPAGVAVFGPGIDYGVSSAHEDSRVRGADNNPAKAFCLHTWDAGEQPVAKTTLMRPVLRDCARRVKELLESGVQIRGSEWKRVEARDIAVLAPEHKQLEIVRRELRRLGIPAAYQIDASVYLSNEARDLNLLLRALAAPRLAAVKAALCTPFFGYSLNEVAGINEEELSQHVERIHELAERLKSEGFMPVLFALLRDNLDLRVAGKEQEPVLVRLAGSPDGERILTNCIQLGELLQQAWAEGHARSAEALKDFLDQAIANAEGGGEGDSVEASKLRLETDAPAVILSTIHKSKGLQYPIVFLPAMWSQKAVQQPPCIITHGEKGACEMVLPGDPDWLVAFKAEQQRLEVEQMRLLYVSLTRGKHQVHAWWGRVKHDSRWTVSSTRAAFGRLLLKDPKGAESYTDLECAEAFAEAMARNPEATFEVLKLEDAGVPVPTSAVERSAPDGAGEAVESLAPARWTRTGLGAAPLQSSYSALLRRKTEAYRSEDEAETLPVEDGESMEVDAAPVLSPVKDVLELLQGGRVLGDRVHCAFEMAMAANDRKIAGELFVNALAPDLPGLLRNGEVMQDCVEVARQLWEQTAGATLLGGKVADLLKGPHAPEWGFLLPQGSQLTPTALAEVLEHHGAGSPWGAPAYVKRVSELGFVPLSGYFEGIVDLLGRLPDGRWVLADYKTNHLNHYGCNELTAAMAESHYLLQALLYTVAVKRWLERAIKGWTYDVHFAGAAYLFLRGMKAGTERGIWLEKPPTELANGLDHLFMVEGSVRS